MRSPLPPFSRPFGMALGAILNRRQRQVHQVRGWFSGAVAELATLEDENANSQKEKLNLQV